MKLRRGASHPSDLQFSDFAQILSQLLPISVFTLQCSATCAEIIYDGSLANFLLSRDRVTFRVISCGFVDRVFSGQRRSTKSHELTQNRTSEDL
jgi:hypothetical protein